MSASREEILGWLQAGLYTVVDDQIYSRNGKLLSQRINKRNRCDYGDPRVDLYCNGQRASIHVSNLVWMWNTSTTIPDGWEIHHRDENPLNNNFNNLIAVHPIDHAKLHATTEEEIPF